MGLVDRWQTIERDLPSDWSDASLLLTPRDASSCDRVAALLAPAGPGRSGDSVRVRTARRGGGIAPEGLRRLLARIDAEGIRGDLALVSSDVDAVVPAATRTTLAASWDAALAVLPGDWSDLLGELELASSDYLDRAALLTAPVNPARFGDRPGFRFRCARRFGYGASPAMVRRCLERLDGEPRPILGSVRVVRVLSDSEPVATQGPVWYVGGKAV